MKNADVYQIDVKFNQCILQNTENFVIVKPAWMSDDEEESEYEDENEDENASINSIKLQNLLTRRKVYGDITQNVSERQIKRLLVSSKQSIDI